jgi:hypothetical protein
MQMILELLQQLAAVVTANEKAQRRFRAAIAIQVAKIDTTVRLIHGAQIVETHGHAHPEEAQKHAKDADEFISDASDRLGLSIVKFTYDETADTAPPRGKNRKWSSWEI